MVQTNISCLWLHECQFSHFSLRSYCVSTSGQPRLLVNSAHCEKGYYHRGLIFQECGCDITSSDCLYAFSDSRLNGCLRLRSGSRTGELSRCDSYTASTRYLEPFAAAPLCWTAAQVAKPNVAPAIKSRRLISSLLSCGSKLFTSDRTILHGLHTTQTKKATIHFCRVS